MSRSLALTPLLLLGVLLQDPVRLPLADALRIWGYPLASVARCPVDTLLVMGAAQYDGVPSPVFRARLDHALELFEEGCARRLVVSGGRRPGDRFSEGEAGVRYLAAHGVPAEALVAETAAKTSYENIRNSLPWLRGDAVLIVTDDMHAFRTRWLAHHFGIDAEVSGVATQAGRLEYGARELVSLLAYQVGYRR